MEKWFLILKKKKRTFFSVAFKGFQILNLKFDYFKTFSEGYLIIKSIENYESYDVTSRFYDRSGKSQFNNYTFTDANPFYNGLAKVKLKGDS